MCGPWAELYSEAVQRDVLGIRPGSQRQIVVGPDAAVPDDFIAYSGKPSEFEQHADNFARNYVEN